MISIELPDLANAIKQLHAVPRETADWAITRTLNDVAGSGKAEATRFIFQRYYFRTQGPIQRGIKATRVTSNNQVAVIRFQGSRFPISQFLPTQTSVGVEFTELREKRSTLSKAFMAIMQYGTGVFKREPGAGRYPIRTMYGLSIANMAREQKEILPEIKRYVEQQLGKRMKFWVGEALAGNQAKYQRKH
jgi:hypothetical protein